jgi:hypothetical protein
MLGGGAQPTDFGPGGVSATWYMYPVDNNFANVNQSTLDAAPVTVMGGAC